MADDDQFGGPDSFIDSLYDDLDDDSDDGHGAAQLHRKGRNESSDTNNDDRDMSNRERHGDAGISVRKKQKTDQNQNSFTRRANDAEEEGEEDGKGGQHSYDDDDDEQQQQLEEEEGPRSSLIERLQDENKCLKRNISILFRTAKNELQRKDDQVRRLQEEVDSLRRQRQRLDGQQQRPSHQQTSGGSSVTSIDDRRTINLLPYDNAVSSNADSIESGRRSSR